MAAVSNTADIAISTADSGDAEYNGAGEVLRRGDGILVYLMNIPRPQEIREEVDEVGAVTLPLIGQIHVTGLRTSQAEDAIKDAYISGGFYRKIDVIVMADAGTYYVRGEVKRPGSFPLSGDITLIQAVATAGGYTDFARRSRIKVISGSRDITFDGDRIEDGDEPDPLIKANDTIIVPRRKW
jgi:polysaccharide export outer membrane protein